MSQTLRGKWHTPTAARLTAAIAFGCLSVILSNMVIDAMPTDLPAGHFIEINIALAALSGWLVAGSRAPAGYIAAISYGLTAIAVFLFLSLLTFSGYQMVINALRRQYDSGMEALVAVFEGMLQNFWIMATYEILGAFAIGAALAGLLTEWVGQRFA
ncbi:TrgA family protein [Pseudaestuariivita rosea]|uniref:TrgA family protein n=1 Tax=Pseudaestuariivita rosea TaxID=2763263 RepID=UPI001ABAC9B6|nr:TrgA family protein [Pseudaestuariivita rosea]